MKSCVVLILTVASVATASAQSPALADSLQQLERESWVAWQNHDGKFFQQFLSDDHVDLGAWGDADKAAVVKNHGGRWLNATNQQTPDLSGG